MDLSESLFQALARSSGLELDPEELDDLRIDLKKILTFAENLESVCGARLGQGEPIEPCTHPVVQSLALRSDEIEPSLPRERFLENCPQQIAGLVRVPTILKEAP